MKLACNIDHRGRKARLVTGAIVDVCGSAGIIAGVLRDSTGIFIIGILLFMAGSFMIFEGARGWFALRALGIKTRL